MLEFVFQRIFGIDDAMAFLGAPQRFRQAVIGLRADDDVDGRRAAKDFLALGLGDAAGNADHHLAPVGSLLLFHLAQTAERRIDLLGGLFADMAGVQENEVGLLHVLGRLIAVAGERIAHARRVVDVHLAAIGLDEDLAAVAAIAEALAGGDLRGRKKGAVLGHGGLFSGFLPYRKSKS